MKVRATLEKRRKEKARQDKKRDKLHKRSERKDRKVEMARRRAESAATGDDPDIAHIVPGPQPIAPELDSAPEDPSSD